MNEQAAPPPKELKGIGGWLLVYVILAFVGLIFSIIVLAGLGALGRQAPELGRIISTLTVLMIIGLALIVLELIIIFLKKKWAPMVIVVLLAIGIVINIVTIIMVKRVQGGEIVGMVLSCLWIGYFLKSTRVKNTFIN
jgi:hypothetical protein